MTTEQQPTIDAIEQKILDVARSEGFDEGETWWPQFAHELAQRLPALFSKGRVWGACAVCAEREEKVL